CLTREPSLASMLNRTADEVSVAVNSFNGILTRPKRKVSDAMDRAAMEDLASRWGGADGREVQHKPPIAQRKVPGACDEQMAPTASGGRQQALRARRGLVFLPVVPP